MVEVEDSRVTDVGSFVSDVTLPDGSVVAPGQALVKTWRVRNSGTSTWGAGYKLVFVDGEQMGAPLATAVPSTAAGATADLSISLTAPSAAGNHSGYFQLRNQSGTYFGPKLSVKINVSSPSSKITIFAADPPSPANTTKVRFHVRTDGVSNFRAMRILVDGVVKYELGTPDFYYDWETAGYSSGDHSIIVEVADQTDTSWSHPDRKGMTYTLQGTAVTVNHQPNPPLPLSPYDWYVYYSGSTAALCAQAQGDPDGDAISSYYFEIHDSGQNWSSGWTGSNCVNTSSLAAYNYQWHVKVQDSRGAVSDWSKDFHFTIVNQNLSISSFDLIPLDGNSENVRLKACVTGQGGVGITIRFLVNSATNGTDSGYWTNVGELGVPCFTDVDAPIWHTLEDNALSGDGQHLVRVQAHGAATGWNGAVSQDKLISLPHRRPSDSRLKAPIPASRNNREVIYLNSRSVPFSWYMSDRAAYYWLSVSLNPSPKDDLNPIFRQRYDTGVTQATVDFGQDYPTLYWQIEAIDDVGSNSSTDQIFGIDRIAPTCSIQPLSPVSYENNFQVQWNGSDSLSGVGRYNIQYKDSRSNQWSDWLTSVPAAKTYDLFIGQPGHTYSFRCQATDNANNPGLYPDHGDTSITVDPTARPAEPWWNPGYAGKRNITIQNNMPAAALPAAYLVNVQFTSGTTPSAAEVYNLSQSASKCDDLRIVYNNTTELNRLVKACGPDMIDIWFRTQVGIPAAGTDASHQIYIGNASAGSPPADAGLIWYPYRQADTTNLYLFQEGSGSTANDYSGNGRNCTINPTVSWGTGKWGSGLHFARANNGNTVSLTCGSPYPISALTAEFWWKSDITNNSIDGRLAGQIGPGGQMSWLVSVESDRLKFERWCNGGSQQARGNVGLRQQPYYGQWNYLAVSFDGGSQVKFYVNGNLDTAVTLGNSCSATYNIPLEIGSVEGNGQGEYSIGAFRLSNTAKTDFYPGTFASITNAPSTAAGSPIAPPTTGSPDLAILSLTAYPNAGTGTLVQAVVQNQGNLDTLNGFFTDVYVNHLPTGSGYYTGSIQFWVNDPIAPGSMVTLTSAITNVGALRAMGVASMAAGEEVTGTLYAQVDSTGAVSEAVKANNIYGAGVELCLASDDAYEPDETAGAAKAIALGEVQRHNLSHLGDHDWVRFAAQAGQTFLVATSSLSSTADTYLYLYGPDGTTLLAANDDYGGTLASRIEWTAPAAGTYYVLVQHWNPNVGGCGTSYDLVVSRLNTVFLPLMVRSDAVAPPLPTPTSTATAIPTATSTPTPTPTPTPATTPNPPGWVSRASMPAARWILGVAAATNGKVYAMGGTSGAGAIAAVVEYDPATDSWATRANIPTARCVPSVTTASNGKIYVIGGSDCLSANSVAVEEYSPAANTWVTRTSMPTARGAAAAAATVNGKIYVIGGHGTVGPINTVEEYDVATDTWTSRASLPTARYGLAAVAGSNGRIYAIGGMYAGGVSPTGEVNEYDLATNTWVTRASMPTARHFLGAATADNGKIYVIGGITYGGAAPYANVEEYDPATNTWATWASMPTARWGLGVAKAANGRIYAIGGDSANGSYLATVEALTLPALH